jgi:hypothetical protein
MVEASGFQPRPDSAAHVFFELIDFYLNPRISPAFVDGHGRRREREVGEAPGGHRNRAGNSVDAPINGGAAIGTKAKTDATAFVADPNEFFRTPFDPHVLLGKPGVEAECAAGSLLTRQAVADG